MAKRKFMKTAFLILALSGLLLTTACQVPVVDFSSDTGSETGESTEDSVAGNASTEAGISGDEKAGDTTEEADSSTESTNDTSVASESTESRNTTSNSNNGTGNQNTNQPSQNTPAPSNPANSNNNTGNTNNTGNGNTSGTNNSSTGNTNNSNTGSNNSTTEHVHSWVAKTQTINHPEEGHWESVMTDPGATWPIYEEHTLCFGCGFDFTAEKVTPPHRCKDDKIWNYGGMKVQVGEQVFPPTYEDRWVVDKAAWTETVTTYTCSCGATK